MDTHTCVRVFREMENLLDVRTCALCWDKGNWITELPPRDPPLADGGQLCT